MKNIFDITVYSQWSPRAGFFLWGITSNGSYMEPNLLKFNLFAWHQNSFYGTFLEETYYKNIPAILISPATALSFFAQSPKLEFITLEWSPEATRLREIAPKIQQYLSEGLWMPDFTSWSVSKSEWKLHNLPDVKPDMQSSFDDEWLSAVINELIIENPSVKQAWQKLEDKYPLLNDHFGSKAQMDEENWLSLIDWKKDDTPFRTCLQLLEPAQDQSWALKIILRGKEDSGVLVEYTEDDNSQVGVLPDTWLEYMDKPERDVARWLQYLPWLEQQTKGRLKKELTEEEAWYFLTFGSLQLVEAGYTVFLPAWWDELRKQKPKMKIKTKSSVGQSDSSILGIQQIIQFDWKIALGNTELSEAEFRQMAKKNKHLMKIHGQWVQVDPDFLRKVQKVLKQKKNGLSLAEVLQMHLRSEAALKGESYEGEQDDSDIISLDIELHSHLARMTESLTNVTSIPLVETPGNFCGSLRKYQQVGYSWLLFLRNFGLGGCLADDMGLGKTIQFIAYLLAVKQREKSPIPSLLICPTSVTGNWQAELERFSPDLKIYLHYGPRRNKGEEFYKAIEEVDLVISTYTLAQIDEDELRSINWNCICLDEAQNIKNAYTKQAAAIRRLESRQKIAMTGTPMENRLTELWSIMDFLNRGYLGSLNSFKKQFVNIIERERNTEAVEQVKKLVHPFLLRRVKTDPSIELDLPEKQEFKERITLTAEQASIYENILTELFEKLDKTSVMGRRGMILATITKLKQLCNHPALLLKEGKGSAVPNRSVKMRRLLEMVEELRSEGDKCLIFTQFVDMGFMIQDVLTKKLGEPVLFLHGGTPKIQRDVIIDRFQNSPSASGDGPGIFILSLKAGGTGLNLTAANHVFHFDRWWNPAVENQATDRAHRIGQNRRVQVHKFVTLGTLEESIDKLIDRKQSMNESIIGGGENWITELSTNELREIFALRREWTGNE